MSEREEKRDLIDILESFNRKERFFLLAQALYESEEEPSLKLSSGFRKSLFAALGIPVPSAPCSRIFVGIDYHLDYIAASLDCWNCGRTSGLFSNIFEDSDGQFESIEGSQRDVDLLVAFKNEEVFHLVILEAKAYSPWTKAQMEPKTKRLKEIFGSAGDKHKLVKPHFLVISPKQPDNIKGVSFPKWMTPEGKLNYLALRLPNKGRLVATRKLEDGKYSKYMVSEK